MLLCNEKEMKDLLQDLRYGLRVSRKPRLHRRCRPLARARHRRQHGHLQPHRRRLLKTLPVEKPGELVVFRRWRLQGDYVSTTPDSLRGLLSDVPHLPAQIAIVRGRGGAQQHLSRVYISDSPNGRGRASPEAAMAELVSGNYFRRLGVRPFLGPPAAIRATTSTPARARSRRTELRLLAAEVWRRRRHRRQDPAHQRAAPTRSWESPRRSFSESASAERPGYVVAAHHAGSDHPPASRFSTSADLLDARHRRSNPASRSSRPARKSTSSSSTASTTSPPRI